MSSYRASTVGLFLRFFWNKNAFNLTFIPRNPAIFTVKNVTNNNLTDNSVKFLSLVFFESVDYTVSQKRNTICVFSTPVFQYYYSPNIYSGYLHSPTCSRVSITAAYIRNTGWTVDGRKKVKERKQRAEKLLTGESFNGKINDNKRTHVRSRHHSTVL